MKHASIVANIGVFTVLFVGHIFAAAMDFDVLFRLIATSITFQTVFFGTVSILLGTSMSRSHRRETNRFSFIVALPLSVGLGWAYGGMQWQFLPLVVVVVPTLLSHLAVDVLLRR
ncbi:MAG: hypothetical protein P8Q40_05780 [Candidatus Poseidonia sp.]|uniref:hypothetical protein n=1 Tax=Poseidonia sp. TaxID=2666344 RepID=UPI0030BD4321|nr:hypothetical protein [Poseidonia sp.]